MRINKLLLALLLCAPLLTAANPMREGHPERYIVQKGDTLWDISQRFLESPWLWPQIWYNNPDIENPHLIYPGDVIMFVYVDGEPRLTVSRDGTDPGSPPRRLDEGTVRLSPRIREESIEAAIPTIPLDAIRPFITNSGVLDERTLDRLPYVLAVHEGRVMGSATDVLYARGFEGEIDSRQFSIVRKGDPFIDPETRRVLGYAAVHLGDAFLEEKGDPASLSISESNREIRHGDRLIESLDSEFPANFHPRAPEETVNGQIIAVLNGVSQIGQFSIVVLNRGEQHKLKLGDVLAIYKRGETVRDPYSNKGKQLVKLPDVRAGELIIFRTFDRLSFGLVMTASRTMHLHDAVRNP